MLFMLVQYGIPFSAERGAETCSTVLFSTDTVVLVQYITSGTMSVKYKGLLLCHFCKAEYFCVALSMRFLFMICTFELEWQGYV